MRSFLSIILVSSLLGCSQMGEETQRPRGALFVGIDVSGSFYNSGHYQDSLEFLSYYLHGRLNEDSELKQVKNLFVGSIGGAKEGEVKSFRPIHDFQGKTQDQIKEDLIKWFPKSDAITDFNVFFDGVSRIAKKRNLSLAPITIVLVSDGIPDFNSKDATFEDVDLDPLEYLSRNVTVRVLYASAQAAHQWETVIPRRRVRMWTVDKNVMEGWRNQLVENVPSEEQAKLWNWISDNVDFRVSRTKPVG